MKDTFPVIIYKTYFAETGSDHNFGAAISVIAIVITAVIFLIQRYVNNQFRFTMNAMHSIERKKITGIKNVLINFYCWFVVALAFMPQVYVMYTSFQKTSGKIFLPGYSLDSYRFAFTHLKNAIPNTFLIGGLALIIVILLAILIAYLVVRRSNLINKIIDTLSMVPYIIPGSVVGIALLMAFNKKPLVLAGTVTIMIIALVIRRIPYTIRSSTATLQQIPMSIEEAAISLGSSKLKAFFTITDGQRHPVRCHHVLGHDHYGTFYGDHLIQPEDDHPDTGNLYLCIERKLRHRRCLCDDLNGRNSHLLTGVYESYRKQRDFILSRRNVGFFFTERKYPYDV